MPKSTVVTLLGTLLLAGLSAGSASADTVFESEVEGIQVGGQTIAGVPGGFPWDVEEGEVRIDTNGDLKVELTGLVLTPPILIDDPVFPVVSVCASLVCQKTEGHEITNEVVASTGSFPLSPVTGDAEIEEMITLPAVCVAPIVLVRASALDSGLFAPECMGGEGTCTPTGVAVPIGCGPWIGASGF